MKANLIERLNILLIIASLVLAYVVPFKLFLFSYAVLGPLHYLTEINWLKENSYFIKVRKWIWVFILLTLIISIPAFLNVRLFADYTTHPVFKNMNLTITSLTDIFLLTLFFFAIGLVYLKHWWHLLFFLVISVVVAKLITTYVLFSFILIGIFLPTIIHVYVFTLLFMIRGVLFKKDKLGMVAIVLLVISPILIFAFPINPEYYVAAESTDIINTARSFRFIQYLTDWFDKPDHQQNGMLSIAAIKIQIFTAFCYTYHYLNWFSKTSVIGWHKNISRTRLSIIIFVWLLVVALFWYDYESAYLALFFLAMLHIILEFPLNVISIKEITSKLIQRR